MAGETRPPNEESSTGLVRPAESYFRCVRGLAITPELADVVEPLCAAVPASLWQAFARVPGLAEPRGWAGRLVSRVREPFDSQRFLRPSPFQRKYRLELERRHGPQAPRLMDFLCRTRPALRSDVESWLGKQPCAVGIARNVLAESGEHLVPCLRFVPYRGHFYVSDSFQVQRWGAEHGVPPAHISEQTHENILWLRRYASRTGVNGMLEMGSGIGMVSLELADLIPHRAGAEYYERSYLFAQLNRRLRHDDRVTFAPSDLFSAVQGKFDLIFFNPWQPSYQHADLIAAYLDGAPAYLSDGGRVAVWISTQHPPQDDPVLKAAEAFARNRGFTANRQIIRSWWAESGRRVDTISCVLFTRGRGDARIRIHRDLAAHEWTLRSTIASARGSPGRSG
jgi:hypothetical protein